MARNDYESLDFDDLTENAGLKPVIKGFESSQLKIASVESNNRAKRLEGLPTKEADIIFEDGQRIRLSVNGAGVIYKVKLNGRAIPIRNSNNIKSAISEISQVVLRNSKKFQTNLRRRSKLTEIATPASRLRTSTKSKLSEANELTESLLSDLAEAEEEINKAKAEAQEKEASLNEYDKAISDTNSDINSLTAAISEIGANNEV